MHAGPLYADIVITRSYIIKIWEELINFKEQVSRIWTMNNDWKGRLDNTFQLA